MLRMASHFARSTKLGSGSPTVAMVQHANSRVRHDPTGSRGGSPAARCLLREAKTRAAFLLVADVLRERPFQMVVIEVQNASPVVADDEEAVEPAEGDGRNGEVIHRGDGFLMVARKGPNRA